MTTLEQLADFLVNDLEDLQTTQDQISYLQRTFNLTSDKARSLIDAWWSIDALERSRMGFSEVAMLDFIRRHI